MNLRLLRLNSIGALLGLGFCFAALGQEAPPPTTTSSGQPAVSLRQAFTNQFLVGVALDGQLPDDYNANELSLIRGQFAALTPANCMKMTHVQPEPGRFEFQVADALVRFATSNQLKVCGHCLVLAKNERTPDWFFRDGGKLASRDVVLERMQKHIAAVAGRYRGKVISWDVVNEALDDGTNFLRPSKWFSTLEINRSALIWAVSAANCPRHARYHRLLF